MDILTHIFLPLALIYGAGIKGIGNRGLLFLSLFAVLPDADVFLGVHRGLFHSLFFVLPLIFLSYILAKKYFKYVAIFFSSHLALDFITGGVPFLYPLVSLGVGVEFPLVIKFGSRPTIIEYLPKLVLSTPMPVHDMAFDVFSSFGVASLVLFLIIYLRNGSR